MYEGAKKDLANVGKNNALPDPLEGSTHHQNLPFLVSTLLKDGKNCKVLDFGGGMGTAYRSCATYTEVENLEIHIIETEAFYGKAKDLFKDSLYVFWHKAIPENLTEVDVVNIGSSLKFVRDYTKVLQRLTEFRSRFVLFTDYYMGKAKTYATKQVNIPDLIIPCWVFNLEEVVDIMTSRGYRLVFKSTNFQKQHKFKVPKGLKVSDSCNLLFSNKSFSGGLS